MKKILVCGMSGTLGGSEIFIMNYYRRLQDKGIHFDFLTNFSRIVFERELNENGSRVIHITGVRQNPVKHFFELRRFFKEHASEYAGVWFQRGDLANIDVLKLAKRYGIPHRIVHSHNSRDVHLGPVHLLTLLLHRWNRSHIDRYATDFWACSQSAGDWLYPERVVSSPHFAIVHNAIDAKKFRYDPQARTFCREQLGLKESTLAMGFVGRLTEQKNPLFLLKIFEEVWHRNRDSVLLLAGDGNLRQELEHKCRKPELKHAVRFLGVRDDIPRLLQAFDVLVMPSLYEGLSLAAIEAQAAGLPCIASTAMSPETKITGNMQFVSLGTSPADWAGIVLKAAAAPRLDHYDDIVEQGYSIEFQTNILYSLLESL